MSAVHLHFLLEQCTSECYALSSETTNNLIRVSMADKACLFIPFMLAKIFNTDPWHSIPNGPKPLLMPSVKSLHSRTVITFVTSLSESGAARRYPIIIWRLAVTACLESASTACELVEANSVSGQWSQWWTLQFDCKFTVSVEKISQTSP